MVAALDGFGQFVVDHHSDAESFPHQLGQLDVQPAGAHPGLGEHVLCGDVEVADVVVAVVEEVADLFERHRALERLRRLGGRARPVALQLLGGIAQAAVDGDQAAADVGHAGNEFFDLGVADPMLGADFGEEVGEVGNQPGIGVGGEVLRGQVEAFGERQQHRDGDRPLVVLQLVDVTGGQTKGLGQRRLGETALVSQPPQPGTRKHLRHR